MLRKILSIAGKPGLFKLVNRGRNMLIVESLQTGKRMPAYSRDKVISLGDIAIYATGDDIPLAEVLELVNKKNEGKHIDIKAFADDAAMRQYFAEILPTFDDDRVYNTDIKKLFQWYNQLLDAGISEYKEAEETEESQSAE